MKIILTEGQLKLVKLIKENTEYAERIKEATRSLGDDCNKLYSVVAFTTIAEIRDGDSDVNVMKQKYEVIYNKKDALDKKLYEFEQRNMNYDGDWNNPKSEEDYNEMDTMLYNLNPKIDALEEIIDGLMAASEPDLHKPFKDIKPINI